MMAGRGPAPKAPEERVSLKVPSRGDWLTLPPLERPVLPVLPDGEWCELTRLTWDAWRADWATQAFGTSEIAMALGAIRLFEEMVLDPKPPRAAEVRQWVDRLGLNLKGKRDLRLRLGAPAEKSRVSQPSAKIGGLRLVAEVPA